MVASLNAFLRINGAKGESKQGGGSGIGSGSDGHYEGWIELQSWEWEVEAESSWTKGSGASVGKPIPGKMSWEHYWDTSSHTLIQNICRGKSFDDIELHMCKSIGKGIPVMYWKAFMTGAFITKVNQSATEEGNVAQKIEMVFKSIKTEYHVQGVDPKEPGALRFWNETHWIIDEGTVNERLK